jgi:hypothetical protein
MASKDFLSVVSTSDGYFFKYNNLEKNTLKISKPNGQISIISMVLTVEIVFYI